jgi:hypothetical protein
MFSVSFPLKNSGRRLRQTNSPTSKETKIVIDGDIKTSFLRMKMINDITLKPVI